MKYQFLNFALDEKDLYNQDSSMIDSILIQNNKSQLNNIYEFYKNDTPILFINGFMGTGKIQLVNYSLNFLSDETVVLKHNCFETTILDDIFLTFFEEFKKLEAQKIIETPKIKSENFNQKIHSYLSTIEKPILIILNSFEALTKENNTEIINFLLHLSSFRKIKVIIIGRTFKASMFPENYVLDRVTTSFLEKSLFEKYLKDNKFKYNSKVLDDLYKYTRGYYFFLILTLKILQKKQLTAETFLEKFKKSFLSYYEFLLSETFYLIPAQAVRFFWFLCLIRHGVSIDLLKQIRMYDEDSIRTLIENKIVTEQNNQIFVQDYFKDRVEASIQKNIALKIHQNIIDIYEQQLPLKPFERTILLSRQTMRKEIEYHSMFLPTKRQITKDEKANELSYVTYSEAANDVINQDVQNNDANKQSLFVNEEPKKVQQEQPINLANSSAGKNVHIDLSKLGFEKKDLPSNITPQEEKMLSDSVKSVEKQNQVQNKTPIIQNEINITLTDIMIFAEKQERNYQYAQMIELYAKALTYKDDNDYYVYLPTIYSKLGLAYQKMSNFDNSIKFYTQAKEFYEKTSDIVKANQVKYDIANVYYEIYKLDNSKALLAEIINTKDMPDELVTKAYILLATIEDGLSNADSAYEYYQKAINLASLSMEPQVLAELYFKYALIADDRNDVNTALDYYTRCISINKDEKTNTYLSSAYSNIATIYLERNQKPEAVKYFIKSYELDEKNNNYDGMYFSASKLVQTLRRTDAKKAAEYLVKSKECAKKTGDKFYIASSYLAAGDFYYNLQDNEKALYEYFNAYEVAKNNFSRDNLNKIQLRIDDIKFRIGEQNYEQIRLKYRNELNG